MSCIAANLESIALSALRSLRCRVLIVRFSFFCFFFLDEATPCAVERNERDNFRQYFEHSFAAQKKEQKHVARKASEILVIDCRHCRASRVANIFEHHRLARRRV